ncbi:MAG: hypothetical protein ABSC93_01625 [Bryobacteraceae bacterium]
MPRCIAIGALMVAGAQAGVIRPLSIETLAGAPVVVAARVEGIAPGGARHCLASLRVLRADPPFPGTHIYLDHYCHGPVYRMANGHPAYANLERGRTYVFPLAPRGNGWKLLAEEGWGLVVPVIEAGPGGEPPASKREFIFREIMNTLLHGTYRDLFRFGGYMQFRLAREMNDEIMTGLVTALPAGNARWLDISTAWMAASPGGAPSDAAPALAARTLQEVPAERRKEGILRNMLRYSALHPRASEMNLLPEFKDDPMLLELLPGYLEQRQKGAVTIACGLAGDGQLALAAATFDAALTVLRDRRADGSDVDSACRLLIRRGSDAQFEQYLAIMRGAGVHDRSRYAQMWQPAWEDKSPRILRILAVILEDPGRDSPWSDVRTCDFGGALLERYTGQKFGYKERFWRRVAGAIYRPEVRI